LGYASNDSRNGILEAIKPRKEKKHKTGASTFPRSPSGQKLESKLNESSETFEYSKPSCLKMGFFAEFNANPADTWFEKVCGIAWSRVPSPLNPQAFAPVGECAAGA
jgi:hypothetical protein